MLISVSSKLAAKPQFCGVIIQNLTCLRWDTSGGTHELYGDEAALLQSAGYTA